MSKTPRLIDIADLANMSVGTVDRVLHERGRVSIETREKILRIAKEIGYETKYSCVNFGGITKIS